MADDTKVTRARRGVSLALPLVCLCLGAPVASDAADFNVWGAEDVNAPAAWALSRGAGVRVAVVDTGVEAFHDELLGRVSDGGWGFDGTVDDTSSTGHGTAVSAVIAANPDNGKGIEGVAPDATIVPFRAFADATAPDPSDVVEALDRAGDSGARVVNASFATLPYMRRNDEFKSAEAALDGALAAHPDTLYVTAAGNEGNDNDSNPVLPCNANVSNVICVGAYAQDRRPWLDTNYGDETVDLYAPGVSIRSATTPSSSSYNYFSGTSMSAAYVSGVAALLFAKVPALTPEDVITLLQTTARSVQAPSGASTAAGSPDAPAALQEAVADRDHDGVYDIFDDCTSADGCPPPTPTPTPYATPRPGPTPAPTPTAHPDPVPQLRTLTARVTRCKAHRACKRSATLKLAPDRIAKVSLRVERQACGRTRCRWSRVLTTSVTAGTRGAKVVVRGKRRASLPKGLYRVIAVPSSAAGTGRKATRMFRVR